MPEPDTKQEPVFSYTAQRTRYLLYIDVHAVKHAMQWLNEETWATACGIGLAWAGTKVKYIPGRFVSHVDLRDVVMGVPTCMECINLAAEAGV